MKKTYIINLIGCDDTTSFKMELNEDELDILDRVSKKSKETSTYGCMPVMDLFECPLDCKRCNKSYWDCGAKKIEEEH